MAVKKSWEKKKDTRLVKKREHSVNNKERETEKAFWRSIKKNYGLDKETYTKLLEDQNGLCAICEKEMELLTPSGKRKKLFVDHDHENGRVRGLLCNNCNFLIGLSKDNPEILRKVSNYIFTNKILDKYENDELSIMKNNTDLIIDWKEYKENIDRSPIKYLNPSIPVEVVENDQKIPTGKAQAVGLIDYGPEHHLQWLVFMDDNKQPWSVPNPLIRAQSNPSMGRV